MYDKVKVISVVIASLNEWLEKIAKHLFAKDCQLECSKHFIDIT